MTDDYNDPAETLMTEAERKELRAAVRGLPRPAPDAAYRERVLARFLEPSEAAVESDPPPIPIEDLQERRPRRSLWWGVGLAAAAAVALVVSLAIRGPEWVVNEAMSEAEVLIDGTSADAGDAALLPLRDGSVITNPGPGLACVEVRDALTFLLAPKTEIRIDVEKAPFGETRLVAAVTSGQIMGRTGPGFPSGGLTIDTGQSMVRITGTTFGVLSGADTTCVCVYEGHVETRDLRTDASTKVSPGHRLTVYGWDKNSRESDLLPLAPLEQQMLDMLASPDLLGARRAS